MVFFDVPKATDSKGKTLTAAAKLFRRQGFHGTALHDILAASGAPRGSLYFHFPKGKEEIGEAALTLAGEAVRAAIAQAAETSANAEVFLMRIARGMAADLEKSGSLGQLEGALLLARTYRSLEPMQRAEQALTRLLQASKD
jgi:TetR/AcrR family transcriptional repressor of lmrAB and yxaGH operons